MSKADEMFEELGYKRSTVNNAVGYINEKGSEFILFLSGIGEPKRICIHRDNTEYPAISMKELKAIYEFCKEKGYLGDAYLYIGHLERKNQIYKENITKKKKDIQDIIEYIESIIEDAKLYPYSLEGTLSVIKDMLIRTRK